MLLQAVVACLPLVIGACHAPASQRPASASDEWTRRYTLTPGGEVQITNRNGPVQITATDDDVVEVHVERIARAATEAAARAILAKIEIRENVSPAAIDLQTAGVEGILIGISWELRYRVRAPRASVVRARTTNGAVEVQGISGRAVLSSSNGGVSARGLAGGVEVRATNGRVVVDLARIGSDLVEVRSTNGEVVMTLPADADANLLASVTNGTIDVGRLKLEPLGQQTARRVRGRLGGGGTPIEVTVTNGSITLGHP